MKRNLEYQAKRHAKSLERWFSPIEALARAWASVKSGDCWWWPEPVQMELF